MKKELIKTDNYLLVVDDSEIKRGDWVYNQVSKEMYRFNENLVNYEKKVIAHLPINDSADLKGVPLLPPLEQEDDVEKLAEEEYPIIPNTSPNVNWDRANKQEGFERGYNKAREKYKFTEEDMRQAFRSGFIYSNLHEVNENSYIQSLSQPKSPTHFEFEMEDSFSKNNDEYIDELGAKGNYYTHLKVIKTTTNSQGQQVACGKYIY